MRLVYWIIFVTSRWTGIQLIPAESRFGDEPFFFFFLHGAVRLKKEADSEPYRCSHCNTFSDSSCCLCSPCKQKRKANWKNVGMVEARRRPGVSSHAAWCRSRSRRSRLASRMLIEKHREGQEGAALCLWGSADGEVTGLPRQELLCYEIRWRRRMRRRKSSAGHAWGLQDKRWFGLSDERGRELHRGSARSLWWRMDSGCDVFADDAVICRESRGSGRG